MSFDIERQLEYGIVAVLEADSAFSSYNIVTFKDGDEDPTYPAVVVQIEMDINESAPRGLLYDCQVSFHCITYYADDKDTDAVNVLAGLIRDKLKQVTFDALLEAELSNMVVCDKRFTQNSYAYKEDRLNMVVIGTTFYIHHSEVASS